MISHSPNRIVLQEVAAWLRPRHAGHTAGCAFALTFGVPTAHIIDGAQTPQGIKVDHVWLAEDVGTLLDPGNGKALIIPEVNIS